AELVAAAIGSLGDEPPAPAIIEAVRAASRAAKGAAVVKTIGVLATGGAAKADDWASWPRPAPAPGPPQSAALPREVSSEGGVARGLAWGEGLAGAIGGLMAPKTAAVVKTDALALLGQRGEPLAPADVNAWLDLKRYPDWSAMYSNREFFVAVLHRLRDGPP